MPLDESGPVREFGERLALSLERIVGSTPVLRAARHAARARVGVAVAPGPWREQVETEHGAVVYVANPTFDAWTDECVAQADLVVLVAAAEGSQRLRGVEDELAQRAGATARRSELVLLHAPATATPAVRGVGSPAARN